MDTIQQREGKVKGAAMEIIDIEKYILVISYPNKNYL